jgi:hypothetical protein
VVSEVAEKLKAALSDATEVTALGNRTKLQIKTIDRLITKEELVEDMRREGIEVRTLRMGDTDSGGVVTV